jgi:ribonuclease T2
MSGTHNNGVKTITILAAVLLLASAAEAKHKKPKPKAEFDYYLLVLSYGPDFCDENPKKQDVRECGPGRHVGFVVHGLWPQGENSRGPENCGSASPVAQSIIQVTLNYIPTEGLIQHEWAAHGTCSGLSADDYFALLRKARDSVKIPDQLKEPSQRMQLNAGDLESAFAAANPTFSKDAFRSTCYQDQELQEARICLNKDLSPRPCGSSAGLCSASKITVLPVR